MVCDESCLRLHGGQQARAADVHVGLEGLFYLVQGMAAVAHVVTVVCFQKVHILGGAAHHGLQFIHSSEQN